MNFFSKLSSLNFFGTRSADHEIDRLISDVIRHKLRTERWDFMHISITFMHVGSPVLLYLTAMHLNGKAVLVLELEEIILKLHTFLLSYKITCPLIYVSKEFLKKLCRVRLEKLFFLEVLVVMRTSNLKKNNKKKRLWARNSYHRHHTSGKHSSFQVL